MHERLRENVAAVVALLVEKNFERLVSLTRGIRLSSEEIARAVADYGRILIEPPTEAYELMQVVPVEGSKPRKWSVTMPLWTQEEGRSDLSVSLTLIESPEGLRVELDDLHVL